MYNWLVKAGRIITTYVLPASVVLSLVLIVISIVIRRILGGTELVSLTTQIYGLLIALILYILAAVLQILNRLTELSDRFDEHPALPFTNPEDLYAACAQELETTGRKQESGLVIRHAILHGIGSDRSIPKRKASIHKGFDTQMINCIKVSGTNSLEVRQVFLVPNEARLDQILARLNHRDLHNAQNYKVRFFLPPFTIPFISPLIIGDDVGFLGFDDHSQYRIKGGIRLSGGGNVKLLVEHFDEIWNREEAIQVRSATRIRMEKVEEVRTILRSMHKNTAKSFEYTDFRFTGKEGYEELISAVEESKQSIKVIAWSDLAARLSNPESLAYFKSIPLRLKRDPSLSFQWLGWNEEHYQLIKEVIPHFDEFPNASFRIMSPSQSPGTPRVPCFIRDESLVLFGSGYLGNTATHDISVISNREPLATVFNTYFESLWNQAVSVRDRNETYSAEKYVSLKTKIFNSTTVSIQDSEKEAFRDLISAYQKAQDKISIVSWRDLNIDERETYKQRYFDVLFKAIKENPKLRFRRLFWTKIHLDFLNYHPEFHKLPNVEYRFLPTFSADLPIVPTVIIDEEIVNFGWGYLGHSPKYFRPVNLHIESNRTAQYFEDYFESLWNHSDAIILKEKDQPVLEDAVLGITA